MASDFALRVPLDRQERVDSLGRWLVSVLVIGDSLVDRESRLGQVGWRSQQRHAVHRALLKDLGQAVELLSDPLDALCVTDRVVEDCIVGATYHFQPKS